MSSYPPPPPSAPDGTAPTSDAAHAAHAVQQGADADSHQSHAQAHPPAHPQSHPQYAADAAAAAAAAAAVAAAHHGLQALQAAVAAPTPGQSMSPVTPQHALVDTSFLPVGPSSEGATPNPKATRLRRACDMCSQRKVKVRPVPVGMLFLFFCDPVFLTEPSARSAMRHSHADHAASSTSTAPSTAQ